MSRRKHMVEGIIYYLLSFLLARPRKKIVKKFIKRIVEKQVFEFKPYDVFLVHNVDVGALLVSSPRFYIYIWRYEREPLRILKCLLSRLERGLFIDVGAYVGFYTVLAARHGWDVVCFEPNPLSLILLKYNIDLHRVEGRVRIVGKAAGDKRGYTLLAIASSLSESSSTRYLRDELKLFNMLVEVETVDSVVRSLSIDRSGGVNLVLKVDVEGFGLNVLKGAAKTIEEFKPFILFEVHRTFDEEDEIYALKMLRDMGYEFMVLEPRSKKNFIVYAYPKQKGCLCCEKP